MDQATQQRYDEFARALGSFTTPLFLVSSGITALQAGKLLEEDPVRLAALVAGNIGVLYAGSVIKRRLEISGDAGLTQRLNDARNPGSQIKEGRFPHLEALFDGAMSSIGDVHAPLLNRLVGGDKWTTYMTTEGLKARSANAPRSYKVGKALGTVAQAVAYGGLLYRILN